MKKLGYALAASLIALAAAPAFAGADHGGHGKHGGWFKALDTDGDGKISQAEFDAAKADRFAKADADGDGKVTADEMKQAFERKHEERMKKHEARMEEHFKALDTDGDGAVSEAEMQAHHVQMFSKLDADGDGFVSEEELKAHKKSHMEHKGEGDKPASE